MEVKTEARIKKEDLQTMSRIANRAIKLGINLHVDKLSLVMDIESADDISPLRLDELLHANDGDFIHDIGGIQQNLNRKTKEMDNCFVPRYARQ